jgi:hypothetical protein
LEDNGLINGFIDFYSLYSGISTAFSQVSGLEDKGTSTSDGCGTINDEMKCAVMFTNMNFSHCNAAARGSAISSGLDNG